MLCILPKLTWRPYYPTLFDALLQDIATIVLESGENIHNKGKLLYIKLLSALHHEGKSWGGLICDQGYRTKFAVISPICWIAGFVQR